MNEYPKPRSEETMPILMIFVVHICWYFVFIFVSGPGSTLWFFCWRSISKVESTISGGGSWPILLRLCSIITEIPCNINFQSVPFCINHSLSLSTLYFLNDHQNTLQCHLLIEAFLRQQPFTIFTLWFTLHLFQKKIPLIKGWTSNYIAHQIHSNITGIFRQRHMTISK